MKSTIEKNKRTRSLFAQLNIYVAIALSSLIKACAGPSHYILDPKIKEIEELKQKLLIKDSSIQIYLETISSYLWDNKSLLKDICIRLNELDNESLGCTASALGILLSRQGKEDLDKILFEDIWTILRNLDNKSLGYTAQGLELLIYELGKEYLYKVLFKDILTRLSKFDSKSFGDAASGLGLLIDSLGKGDLDKVLFKDILTRLSKLDSKSFGEAAKCLSILSQSVINKNLTKELFAKIWTKLRDLDNSSFSDTVKDLAILICILDKDKQLAPKLFENFLEKILPDLGKEEVTKEIKKIKAMLKEDTAKSIEEINNYLLEPPSYFTQDKIDQLGVDNDQ